MKDHAAWIGCALFAVVFLYWMFAMLCGWRRCPKCGGHWHRSRPSLTYVNRQDNLYINRTCGRCRQNGGWL